MNKFFVLWTMTLMTWVLIWCGSAAPADPVNSVAAGDTISVNYVWSLQEDGSVFDTSIQSVAEANDMYNPARPYEPLSFTVGAGQMIPGFDSGVVGMQIGETKTITIAPADGYGERSDEAIQDIPSDPFDEQGIVPVVGEQYNFGIAPGTVTAVGSGTITVDFNHFLAGKTLEFEVTVEWITKAGAAAEADVAEPAPSAEAATWS